MPRARTAFNLVLVSAFAAICLVGIGFIAANMGLSGPWSKGFALQAAFDSANGLVPQAEVRVSGVHVGRVLEITGDGGGGSLVKMELSPGIQLRQGTRAMIRPKTLLGEKFVELIRPTGSGAAYLESGATIPRSQTGQAVEIDDILNAMDPQTRQAMSQSFQQLGVALDGRAADINATIGPLDATMTNLRPLARVGEARQQELDRILTNLNTIMQALADEQDQLGRIVDSGDQVMSAMASRDQALAGTVQNAAAVFASLDLALRNVTPANRASGQRVLALTNPQVDQLLPELLLGQISYPNHQLNVANAESLGLAAEWISAFAQQDAATGYHELRITSITPSSTVVPPSASANGPAQVPVAPSDLLDLLLQSMGSAK
ncbi:MAG: MCE family protein [Chloroflexi bacterium]|nr:MAG: MCE family protein [Chloroflexota bacterium]